MKYFFALGLVAIFPVHIALARESAPSDDLVFYSGIPTISKFTVFKDGNENSYEVPADHEVEVNFASHGKSLTFGPTTQRPPFIAETPVEVKIPLTAVTAVRYEKIAFSTYVEIPVEFSAEAVVVVPAGAKVFGKIDDDGKTLLELRLLTDDSAPMRIEPK